MNLIETLFRDFGMESFQLPTRSFAGRTDKDIFSEIIEINGIPSGRFAEVRNRYITALDENLGGTDVNPIDGVSDALDFAGNDGVHSGLLTGNFRESAYIKLSRIGLDACFSGSVGAFGCHHADRNDLPEIAFEEAKSRFGNAFQPRDMVIIGDTPADVECAKRFGAVSVAVATGYCAEEILRECGPDILLKTLQNPESWARQILGTA